MTISFFDQITNPQNIREAYFDIAKKFDEDIKTYRYRGADGLHIHDLDFISEKVFKDIRHELLTLQEIAPAYQIAIPKKNGKKREIFIYPIKERIKAQAIYRILEPFFDNYFSSFLFSYRTSHPSYYAARSAVRRYKRYYGENYVFVTDIKDYADTIDHAILLGKIKTLELDEKTVKLLELFIKTKTHESGKLITRPCGVLTGTPLYALLSNFYMDEFDKWAGKYVAFYRRVGDDIIAMDKNETKIKEVHRRLLETTQQLNLQINKNKESLIKDTESFKFLGYKFHNGLIGFDDNALSKIKINWEKRLTRRTEKNIPEKIRHFKRKAKTKENNHDYIIQRIIEQKSLVDDTEQIKKLSDYLIETVSFYFFGYNNKRKIKETKEILKNLKIRSLLEHYLLFHSKRMPL